MSKIPLNRTTAPQVIRLFDTCFKQGVLQAMEFGDDYAAKEFLDRHKAAGDYGLIYDDEKFDWRRWRFVLERWCREFRIGSIVDTYLDSVYVRSSSRRNFLFAIIPISMRFYLMGIEEWLDYPNPGGAELFRNTRRIHWKPVPQHLRVMTTADIRSYVQEFIYERQKMALEGDLTDNQYDEFSLVLWKMTQKYVSGVKTKEEF